MKRILLGLGDARPCCLLVACRTSSARAIAAFTEEMLSANRYRISYTAPEARRKRDDS